MPDSPSDPPPPARPGLPAHRTDGSKPRAFADHVADPIGLPSDGSLKPAPPEILAGRSKASLPSHRQIDRGLPTLTPAPYQAEPTGAPAPPTRRTALPGPRHPDEHPKFRQPSMAESAEAFEMAAGSDATEINSPTGFKEEHDPPPTADASPVPETTEAPESATPRHAKHRLAENRTLEFKRRDNVESDPEITEAWGDTGLETTHAHRRSRKLLLWAALIAIPLVGFAVWQSLGRPGAPTPASPPPIESPSSNRIDPAEESRRASDFVKQYFAAPTIEARAAFVRHPEVTKPRMESWYSPANPLPMPKSIEFEDRSAEQTIDGVDFLMLTMRHDGGVTQMPIAVEKRPDGSFLIDWESSVSWSDPRWPEFLTAETPGSHDFRVLVSITDYFNFGYSDPKAWFAYKLEDPDRWASCWGYCSINSEAGMKINRMIRRQRQHGQNSIKAILKLKFDEAGKGKNQVLIEDVVQDGWIKTDP